MPAGACHKGSPFSKRQLIRRFLCGVAGTQAWDGGQMICSLSVARNFLIALINCARGEGMRVLMVGFGRTRAEVLAC